MLHGEQQGKFDLSFTTPAQCAEAVGSGRADVGIIPAIELQRIENLQVIPGVSISSLNEVKSVLLLSNCPIERIRTIALDTSSRTSVALVSILLREFYKLEPVMAPAAPEPDAMLAQADAALLIGDPAIKYRARGAHVYDLGAEWSKFTGLPCVFALWAGLRQARLEELVRDFQDSRDYGLRRTGEIAAHYAARVGLTPNEVKMYLTRNINYNFEESHRRGLNLFYQLAWELGLIPAVRGLDFAGSARAQGV